MGVSGNLAVNIFAEIDGAKKAAKTMNFRRIQHRTKLTPYLRGFCI
jgi:hypothetical protein